MLDINTDMYKLPHLIIKPVYRPGLSVVFGDEGAQKRKVDTMARKNVSSY